MRPLIYIDNQLIDIDPGTVIAYTIQKIDIGDLRARSVNYTNQFKVPQTENNEIIFGISSKHQSRSIIPYRIHTAKIIQNGFEIRGTAIIKKFEDGYSVNVFEDLFDFFAAIKGKTLEDVAPIDNSAWNAAAIDAARLNTEGIITALLHWGRVGLIYQYNFFLPCFFYHTFIKKMFTFAGIQAEGDILTDARFTDLVIPFPKDKFNAPVFPAIDTVLQTSGTQSFNNYLEQFPEDAFGNPTRVIFDTVISGGSGWNSTTNKFTFPAAINATVTVKVQLNYPVTWNDVDGLFVHLRKNASTLLSSYFWPSPSSPQYANMTYIGDFLSGDIIDVVVTVSLIGATGANFSIGGDPTFTNMTIAQNTASGNRDLVYWNSFFGDISCEDLLKDFFVRFAIVPKQVNGVLILKTLQEILADKINAIDWSGKTINDPIEINFDSGQYGQVNNFDYTNVANDETLGRGIISIDNTTLEYEKNVFTSSFENIETGSYGLWNLAKLRAYNADSADIFDIKESPGLKLLTLRNRDSYEFAITFDTVARSDYKVAYFVDSSRAKDTGLQYFLDQFYPRLSDALQRTKIIKKRMLLNQSDINAYDPHKLVWDGESFYFVNRINNFVPNELTEVELFKVL